MRAKHWLVGAAMTAAAGGAAQAQGLGVGSPTAFTGPDSTIELTMEPLDAPLDEAAAPAVLEEAQWTVVGIGELETMSGGQAVVVAISNHDLDAINRNNTINADSVGSGNVDLGANAFSGFNGIGNFVINTGHNNNLQGSLSVNVVVAQ